MQINKINSMNKVLKLKDFKANTKLFRKLLNNGNFYTI